MNILTHRISYPPKWILPTLFVLGVVVLIGTWLVLYWAEALFTESHLVGYYCCVTEQDLPAPGTLERTLSDFFRGSPGMYLPSLIFVAINISLFAFSVWRRERSGWWLPYLFIAFNIFYVLVDFWLISISWSISTGIVGLQTSAYKGYERTWYGIVLHFIWWGGFIFILSRILKRSLSQFQVTRR